MSDSSRRAIWPVIGLAAAGLAIAAFSRNIAFYHDDAFITLRYCRNFIQGNGIVWNAGEIVEGYTNFMHLQAISLLGRSGIDLVLASRLVSGFAYAGLLVLLLAYWRRPASGRTSSLALIPLFLTVTSFPLIVWTLGGLEAPLYALLATGGALLMARAIGSRSSAGHAAAAGALFALAAMTRPDGIGLFGLSAIFLALYTIFGHKERSRVLSYAPIVGFVAAFAIVFVPYFLWRFSYYGDLLPNTFYVKGTGGDYKRWINGSRYVWSYLFGPPYAGLLLAAGLVVGVIRRSLRPSALYLLFLLAGYLSYVVYVGGDHMPAFRFLVPVVPIAGILIHLLLEPRDSSSRPWTALLVCGAIVAFGFLQLGEHGLNPRKADPAAYKGGIIGRYVRSAWPVGSVVALNTAGSTPYEAAEHRFIDMLGLNDRAIAHREVPATGLAWQKVPGHAKGDGAYVLRREPDFIIIGPAEGTSVDDPWFLSDLEISHLKEQLDRHYRMESVVIDVDDLEGHESYLATAGGSLIFTYYRRFYPPATPG